MSTRRDSGRGDAQAWDDVWSSSEVTTTYTESAPHSVREFWQRCYFEDLRREVGSLSDLSVVELGCGRATTSMYCARDGARVALVDLAPAALSQAKELFRAHHLPDPATFAADACNTGLDSNAFDVVYNIGVLEHFVDPLPLIREAVRLLKPGGLLWMVIVPDVPTSRSLPARLLFRPLPTIVIGLARSLGYLQPQSAHGDITRTKRDAGAYLRIARDVGLVAPECLPYNSYHNVYRSLAAQRLVLMPVYRGYYHLRSRQRQRDVLRAHPSLALCLLLKGRKPSST